MISLGRRGFSKRSKLVHSKKSARIDMAMKLRKLIKVAMAKLIKTNCRQL